MSTFGSVEEAREYFKKDRFAAVSGITLEELYEGGCACAMEVCDNHRNALGGIMGGAIFTLADFAFAVASNNDHRPTVALDVSIQYLASPQGSRLTARASRVKSGRTTCVFQVSITDDLGRDVALFTGTGYKL